MHKLTLGQALAYLEAELTVREPKHTEHLTPSETAFLQNLKNRLQKMELSQSAPQILSAIPKHECHSASPYLANNSDFFLAQLIMRKKHNPRSIDFEQPFKHLNFCFQCFEIYCQVMQDYIRERIQGAGE